MDEHDELAKRFEANRKHLRAVAYRMLGSSSEADDAVQEAWLRLGRTEQSEIHDLGGWLTTVVARVCLDMLRGRRTRREEPDGSRILVTIADRTVAADPEQETLLADSVGLALLVILETLTPAERLAFVLHDLFGMPFEEIAPIVGRSLAAAKQLASRARRRVQGVEAVPNGERHGQREIVEAFLAATRGGDMEHLLALLDPDAEARADAISVRGAHAVAKQAFLFSRGAPVSRLALVDGSMGLVVTPNGRMTTVLAFQIVNGKIAAIDVYTEPSRFHELDLAFLP